MVVTGLILNFVYVQIVLHLLVVPPAQAAVLHHLVPLPPAVVLLSALVLGLGFRLLVVKGIPTLVLVEHNIVVHLTLLVVSVPVGVMLVVGLVSRSLPLALAAVVVVLLLHLVVVHLQLVIVLNKDVQV